VQILTGDTILLEVRTFLVPAVFHRPLRRSPTVRRSAAGRPCTMMPRPTAARRIHPESGGRRLESQAGPERRPEGIGRSAPRRAANLAAASQPTQRRLTMATAYSIGIDLHRSVIQICVLDERGERVAEERIRYRGLDEGREAIAWLHRFAPSCRIAVEALGLNRWFVNACFAAGPRVLVCAPPPPRL